MDDTISKESKMIIASNLTVAALLRDLIISQKEGRPVHGTEDVIIGKFEKFIRLLDQKSS